MSRAYTIRIAETERRYIHAKDSVCTDIELLPILPPARLSEILGDELASRGFHLADGRATRTEGGVKIEVELESGRVTATVEEGREVSVKAERTVRAITEKLGEKHEKGIREGLRAELDARLDKDEKQLQTEATAKLEKKLRDLQKEIDEVSNRVAGSALKEKAASMGEILELSEDETGSLTIKVKV